LPEAAVWPAMCSRQSQMQSTCGALAACALQGCAAVPPDAEASRGRSPLGRQAVVELATSNSPMRSARQKSPIPVTQRHEVPAIKRLVSGAGSPSCPLAQHSVQHAAPRSGAQFGTQLSARQVAQWAPCEGLPHAAPALTSARNPAPSSIVRQRSSSTGSLMLVAPQAPRPQQVSMVVQFRAEPVAR